MKTVTVLIPTYNYAHYIQNAIDSILDSNFPQEEIEIITIDDGSTDNTRDVIGKYTDRVRYIYQENKGKASATQVDK
jgi:glycosyltransferase involved in cell wall biosynthesis